MKVRVRLFASLASIAGEREMEWELKEEPTPASLWAQLVERFPDFQRHSGHVKVAINQEYAGWEDALEDGDEVAFLTPVSGGSASGSDATGESSLEPGADRSAEAEPEVQAGSPKGSCWITASPLSVDEVLGRVNRPEAGAIVLFAGVARRFTGQRVTDRLEYDAYPEMAVSEMEKIAAEVKARWPEAEIAMVHRVGTVAIGEASVLIAVSTPHRAEAFQAGKFAIDRLKETVPIWKKEVWATGEMWVGDVAQADQDGSSA